jgi:phospholipid/cholesterol/gamma-HCH transport system substrate-binding protein
MELHYSHRLGSGRIARIVGIFVMIPVLGMILLAVFMAKAEGLFKPHYRLHLGLSESFGLEPGASVVMSGIPIGRVEAVTLTEKGDIDVTLDLVRDYQTRIREDSVAVVAKSSPLVGATQVQIDIGDPAKPVIPDGGRIKAEEPEDVAELLKDVPALLETVKRSLAEVEAITKDVRVAVQTGSRALFNVEQASKGLPQAVESVQHSLASVEKTTAELPEITGSVRKSLATAEQIVEDVQSSTEQLPVLLNTVQESLNNVKAATESVKVTAKQLRPVVRSTQVALDETNTILRGAKHTWPVSAMVKNAGPEPTPGPGAAGSLRGDQLAR